MVPLTHGMAPSRPGRRLLFALILSIKRRNKSCNSDRRRAQATFTATTTSNYYRSLGQPEQTQRRAFALMGGINDKKNAPPEAINDKTTAWDVQKTTTNPMTGRAQDPPNPLLTNSPAPPLQPRNYRPQLPRAAHLCSRSSATGARPFRAGDCSRHEINATTDR